MTVCYFLELSINFKLIIFKTLDYLIYSLRKCSLVHSCGLPSILLDVLSSFSLNQEFSSVTLSEDLVLSRCWSNASSHLSPEILSDSTKPTAPSSFSSITQKGWKWLSLVKLKIYALIQTLFQSHSFLYKFSNTMLPLNLLFVEHISSMIPTNNHK